MRELYRTTVLTWLTAQKVFDIGSGARRFHNPLHDGAPPPFPAYVSEPVGSPVAAPQPDLLAPRPNDPVAALAGRPSPTGAAVPEFSSSGDRALVRVHAAGVADLYGLGEVCGSLRHENRRIVGATTDSFAYGGHNDRLYQAHPWVLGVRVDGTAFGVIVETTWKFTAHVYDHLLFEVEGPPPAVTVIEGATPSDVLRSLADHTGHMPLPPKWALGFQQSKWNYAPADNVRDIAQEFRDRKLPADVIWIDIDYMDHYKVFTFDDEGFPDPAGLIADLHQIGWKSAWMIDPGVKIEPGYHVYDQGIAGDHMLAHADGTTFEGVVWPGPVVFPDFTRSETRDWWGTLYADYLATGIDAVWNDMNEPANLEDMPDKGLPPDVVHRADDELGGHGPHARYRNIYGLQMTRASRDGMAAARPEQRPFLLTRSTFLGGHRFAATWTGDNVSTWEHLGWSIPMALNLGLSGQPFVGPDIGGFAGECTGELLARWMGIGCLFPFARNHNMKTQSDQEPWRFGATVEATCRRALERRYRLLPYLYTLAYEAGTTGLPIMRPAFFADPTDLALRTTDTAFLLGEDLYVRCDVTQMRSGATAPVPVGWRRIELLETGGEFTLGLDGDLPELYLRPGAVLPLGPVMQFTDELPLDHITLLAHLDTSGTAVGRLYEDDGDGHAHVGGAYRMTEFTVSAMSGSSPQAKGTAKVAVTSVVVAGSWPDSSAAVRPVVIG